MSVSVYLFFIDLLLIYLCRFVLLDTDKVNQNRRVTSREQYAPGIILKQLSIPRARRKRFYLFWNFYSVVVVVVTVSFHRFHRFYFFSSNKTEGFGIPPKLEWHTYDLWQSCQQEKWRELWGTLPDSFVYTRDTNQKQPVYIIVRHVNRFVAWLTFLSCSTSLDSLCLRM